MIAIKKDILGIDIRLPKKLANKLLEELQNRNIDFQILDYQYNNNESFYKFKFFTSDINGLLLKLNDIINSVNNSIELRAYIPEKVKDEIERPIHLPGNFIVYPVKDYNKSNINLTHNALLLDSGWAFGSGAHPSTLATITEIIKLSSNIDLTNYKALDVGTGTGILAILLAKLGLKNITALDIDKEAIKKAKINFKLNKVDNNITLLNSSLNTLTEKDRFDLIIANLTPGVLLQLINDIIKYINNDGYIIIASPIRELDILNTIKVPYIYLKKLSTSNVDNWYAFTYQKNQEVKNK